MRRRSSPENSCAIGKKFRGEIFDYPPPLKATARQGAKSRSKSKRKRKRKKKLKHLAPFALIFEHDFAKEADGRHAVIEQLVMEFLQ